MEFKLTESQNVLREKLQSVLSGLPTSDLGDPEPALAAPVEGVVLKPTTASGEMISFYLDLALEQWSKPEIPGDDRLLNIVLACEEAGQLPLDRSIRSLMLSAWISICFNGAKLLTPLLDNLAVSFTGDDMQLAMRPAVKSDIGADKKWKISGRLDLVEGVMNASHLLVDAKTGPRDHGLFLIDLKDDSLDKSSVQYIDQSRRAGAVIFNNTTAKRIGADFSDTLNDIVLLGRVLTTSELLGAADALLSHTCDFVRKRRQFKQAIGNFQSVAHSCAEMFRDVELIRSLLYAAATEHSGLGIPQADAAAQSKALAAELAGNVAEKGLHLFGAEGLRWHRGLHLLMRRIKALQVLFGDQRTCEDVILASWDEANNPDLKGVV